MDPVSAMIVANVVAWWTTCKDAAEAAEYQLEQEVSLAGEAIRKSLRERKQKWADDLLKRLEEGRAGGPTTFRWWAWAGSRVGRSAYFQMKRKKERTADGMVDDQPSTPLSRIWGAAKEGARASRERRRAERGETDDSQGGERKETKRAKLAICFECGHTVERDSLEWTLNDAELPVPMCAACRAARPQDTKADAPRR